MPLTVDALNAGSGAPRWVRLAEAQRFLGVSRTTLWRWRKQYQIRTSRIGRSVYVDRVSLDELVRRGVLPELSLPVSEPRPHAVGDGAVESPGEAVVCSL